jgi:hypothetical protein
MPRIASTLAAALLTCVISAHAQPAAPQGPGQSMLVLDASGSMWGQIGGKPKIEIAREAVASMLATWPTSQQLGLMAYGHRSKGNCADIEMLKAPGSVDKTSFQQSVNALQETCHADPCALGKELEKLGVDFTAHVVGFDIDKNPKAKAELQCLASSTGGRYLDAKDAGELNKALREVAQAPAPVPAPAAPPPACGNFVEGPEFAMNLSTWPTGEHASLSAEAKPFEVIEMGKDANARACQKLCTDEKACTAWFFEAIGSNFRTLPVCHRWDGVAALSAPHEGHPGNAMGVKKGVRQIVREAGAACK